MDFKNKTLRPMRLCLTDTLDVPCDTCHLDITPNQRYFRDALDKGPATHENCFGMAPTCPGCGVVGCPGSQGCTSIGELIEQTRQLKEEEDALIVDIDPGVRRLVKWLRSKNFDTCDSGDGESKPYAKDPESGGRPYPHVIIQAENEDLVAESLRLLNELRDAGVRIYPVGHFEGDEWPSFTAMYDGKFPYIQTTYDPCMDNAFIELAGVNDSKLPPGLGV